MITDAFDTSPEILRPSDLAGKADGFPETVLAVFDEHNEKLLKAFSCGQAACLSAGSPVPIYKLVYGGKMFGFYRSIIGGAGAAGLLEEIIALGAKKVLFFGSCGSLDKNITAGGLIVPTAAYRDEGVSYHYLPASDFIGIGTSQRLSEIFDELCVPYIKTKTWTTDAIYRETRANMEKRRREGCSVVEMECASVMAVGSFRKTEVYQFLYTEDCLDAEQWDRRILGKMPADMRERVVKIALETAARL